MSIRYMGDNQLNQVQNDPNNTPWAKLAAQAEMLERNTMRQPQGQMPQGTVADSIQQKMLDAQRAAYDRQQNADAQKAQLLAQLIGSGQLQGYAPGGVISPYPMNMDKHRYLSGAKQAVQDYLSSQNAPDSAYSDILAAFKGMATGGAADIGTAPQGTPVVDPYGAIKPPTTATSVQPQQSKLAIDDPNKKMQQHDIFQRLLDNSIIGAMQGKGSFGDSLQMYADMFTGKALQGLAEGGEIRGFSNLGYVESQSKAPSFIDAISGNLEPLFPTENPHPSAPPQQVNYNAGNAEENKRLEAMRRRQRGESPTPPPELTFGSPFKALGNSIADLGSAVLPNANDLNELTSYFKKPNQGSDWHAPMQLEGQGKPQSPAPSAAPVTNQATTPVKPPITKDNVTEVAKAHGYAKTQSQVLDAAQKVAALNQTEQALGQTKGEDSTESIYRQFAKDADMDYAELAKRISENEKDLARERKDGTLTAILSGVGAALTRAGTYDQKGDRVFAPSVSQILGTGILGGLESSEAGEKKYQTGIEKNLDALAQLKGLKRAARNDMLDAMNAERQIKATEASTALLYDFRNRELNANIPLIQSQIAENNARAGSYERKGTGAGTSKPMTDNQRATLFSKAFAQAQKELSGGSEFGLMSPEDQQTATMKRANELFATYIGGTNATTPPPADPMDALKAQAAAILAKRPK